MLQDSEVFSPTLQGTFMQYPKGLSSLSDFAKQFADKCEQFANRCARALREQHCCSRSPLGRELILEQFANTPSLLCLGICTKLAYFGESFGKYPFF